MSKITIAIDWFNWTWKWTTAKWVAQALWYTYLDTGAMYRAITLYAIQQWVLDADDTTKADLVAACDIDFRMIQDKQHTFLNWLDVEDKIRTTELALQMKPITTCLPLRKQMIKLQQSFGVWWGIVCEGRDIATHVFPDAQLKVFMTCDVPTRVSRRIKQLEQQWLPVDKDKITQETLERDAIDYLGPNAVNKRDLEAKELDTTHLSIDNQIQIIVDRAHEILQT